VSIRNILLPEYNFVYTYYCGRIDDTQIQAYSDRIKEQLTGFKSYREIIDFSRDTDFSELSSEALNRAGDLEKERPNTGTGPLAILVTDPLTYGLARTYSTFASDSRTDVLISYSLDDCLGFMGLDDQRKQYVKNAIALTNTGACELSSAVQLKFNFAC
jgi:hypothetical protein